MSDSVAWMQTLYSGYPGPPGKGPQIVVLAVAYVAWLLVAQ